MEPRPGTLCGTSPSEVSRAVCASYPRPNCGLGRSKEHEVGCTTSRHEVSRKRSQAKGEAMPIYRVTFLKDIMGVPFPVASIAVRHARSPDRARQAAELRLMAAGRCRTGTSSPIHRTSNGINRSAAPGPLGPQRRRTDDSASPALDGSLPSRRRAVHPGDPDHRVASRIIAAVHKVVELTKPRIARVNEGRVGRREL